MKLSQNFLIDKNIAWQIVAFGHLSKDDRVLEIGGGKGILTELLCQQAGEVFVVEKDRRLAENYLVPIARCYNNCRVIIDDILDFPNHQLPATNCFTKLIANLPYHLTSPIIHKFLDSWQWPRLEHLVIMAQKEVADRLVAPPATSRRGYLTILREVFGQGRLVLPVPAAAFQPQPAVNSAVIIIDRREKQLFANQAEEQKFCQFVAGSFRYKRRLLRHSLALGQKISLERADKTIKTIGLPPNVRAEELKLAEWQSLAYFLSHRG